MSAGFRKFKRREHAELRPYEDSMDMAGVSVSRADRNNGSPRKGDMIARNPDDHSDQWLVAGKFFRKNYVSELKRYFHEAGGSGYSAAFTHPDPIDPNDIQRQRTQSRAGDYPYDSPTSYGAPIGTDSGGAAYQRSPDATPPHPQHRSVDDEMPIGQYGAAWEQLESMLGTYTPGEQADDAFSLGYGSHGRMGEGGMDPVELDMDSLRQDFRTSFLDTLPDALEMGSQGLFALLVQLDPEYSAELFAPDDDEEMCGLYSDWGNRVYAPGAEDDQV